MMNRRSVLSLAPLAGASILAGCATSTNPTTGQVTTGLPPNIVDAVQAGVAAIAQYIPTVESIAQTAASLFGPAYSGIVTVGSAALNQVIAVLRSVVTSMPLAAKNAMRARLRGSSVASPALIGTTTAGVVVSGYRL